jgi:DNA-binding NtrC family response regulator
MQATNLEELDGHLAFVIDDEVGIRTFVAITLAEHGFRTEAFSTAESALAALGDRHPGLIFLDVALLQSDAIDVLIGLGAKHYRGIVHLMSGGRPELIQAVQRLGARHGIRFAPPLYKPFGCAAIAQVVADLQAPAAPTAPTTEA